ncbi:ribonuclease M5 [Aerococcus agrisoli]|uniref:Ribonuclease M5 n=1 Tax=Aerococcus agrisoli TaxID=2487350 RepID=A0A3N4H6H0_9LACT|nr:ribonuclease M5 [Aerococcus agrisoli]RPA60784.1 ribonuclease M5 [Aerococcus agrisoli]
MMVDTQETGTHTRSDKKRIKQVIVVEGKSDTQRLQAIYDVTTIETNGSALSQETLEDIKKAQAIHGVIVFTDPDISGTKIRQGVMDAVPDVQHAFIERKDAKPDHKGSLGVEHASDAAIEEALSHVYTLGDSEDTTIVIPQNALIRLGLVGGSGSKEKRQYLASQLHIGYVNGKQLAKRLALFQITLDQVEAVLANYQTETGE